MATKDTAHHWVIEIKGPAGGRPPPVYTYLLDCDFEALNGLGHITFTQDRRKAKRFSTMYEAREFWLTQSKTVPLRPDGTPNRPLTAYHVCILRDDVDPL